MQSSIDTFPQQKSTRLLRPFGPSIVKMTMPDDVMAILNGAFAKAFKAQDHSPNLAGNMLREFTIDEELLGPEDGQKFVQMLADGSGELYKFSKFVQYENTRDILTERHKQMIDSNLEMMHLNCTVHQSWGNISVAGDFNPIHRHTGAISGVGYLRLPDNIDDEWPKEDHDPSAGMINFVDSRPQDLVSHSLRVKPQVGDIYFFPAWLMHEVFPFRSKGERWSFSFNTTINNLNEDLDLTPSQKTELYEARINAKN